MTTAARLCAAVVRSWPWLAGAALLALAAAAVAPWDAAGSAALRAPGDALGAVAAAAVGLVKPFGRGEVLILAAAVAMALGRKLIGARILLAGLVLAPLAVAIKRLTDRTRPNGGDHSFPSGDTATAFAIAAAIGAGAWAAGRGRAAAAAAALAIAGLVGLGRVVEGWHWPSDVLAGAALGIIAGAVACAVAAPASAIGRWAARVRWWQAAALAAATLAASWIAAAIDRSDIPDRVLASVGAAALPAALLAIIARLAAARWRIAPGRLLALLVAAVAVGYALLAAATSLWDRDEPRNATAALEMLASGDWLVPTFNGEWRLHKPILPYWLMATANAAIDHGAWSSRLPAVLASAGIVAATAAIAWRLVSPWAAVAAAAVLMTAPLLIVSGTAATTDAVLLVGICAGLAMMAHATAGDGRARWAATIVLGLAAGWAQLAKGPIGLAVPFCAVAGALILTRRMSWTWAGHLGVAALIALAVFLAWAVPADIATDGALLRAADKHLVQRGTTAFEEHGGPIFYYLPVVIAAFLPWTLFLPWAAARLVRGQLGAPFLRGLIWAWCVPAFVLFSLYATKLPHYILPVFPGLALLVGAAIAERPRAGPADRRWLAAGGWIVGPPIVIAGGALILAALGAGVVAAVRPAWLPAELPGIEALPALLAPLAGLGVLWLTAAALVRRPWRAGRLAPVAIILAAAVALTLAVACVAAAPAIERLKPARAVAERIRAATGPGVPVFTMDESRGFDEPSLYFYLDRFPVRKLRNADKVAAWAAEPGPGVLVTTRPLLDEAIAHVGGSPAERPLGLTPLGEPIRGFNYSRGKLVEIIILRRGSAR